MRLNLTKNFIESMMKYVKIKSLIIYFLEDYGEKIKLFIKYKFNYMVSQKFHRLII